MKKVFYSLAGLVMLGLTFGSLRAQTVSEATVARMKAILDAESESGRFSGVVLVAHRDEILMNEGFGYADIDAKEPLQPNSKFMIASVSKAFTAAAILQLEQEGKLKVTDSIYKYLPDYPAWASRQITLHQLLTHTSGIPDYINDYPIAFRVRRLLHWKPSKEKLINSFKNKELNFEPGTAYDYSNSGYVLLARIVEKVSGMDFHHYLRKHVLEPLEMNQTGSGDFNQVKGAAVAYGGSSYDPRPLKNFDPEYIYGMGGLHSTAGDLYKWLRALHTNELLNEGEKEKMFTPHRHGYGYGWEITEDDGKLIYSHGGYFPGWNSWVQIYPDDSLYVVILSNQDRSMPFWMVKDMADIWYKNQESAEPQVAEARCTPFPIAGRYIQSYGSELENASEAYGLTEIMMVSQEDASLQVRCSAGKCWVLQKAGPHSWKEELGLFRIDFEDVNGYSMLSITDGSHTWHWTRVGK